MYSVLIVDDFAIDRQNLADAVRSFNKLPLHIIGVCENAYDALEIIRNMETDILICDVEMPGMTGIELASTLRAESFRGRIIFCSLYDKLHYLKAAIAVHSDGYITKPFSMRELLARVKANIRRTAMLSAPAAEDSAMSAGGGITINTDSFQVRKNGVPIDLTQREYELLTFLASHPGKVFSRVDLMEQVWNYGYVGDDARTVDVTVRRLREKIEDNPASPVYILTRRGVGYYFSAQA